MRPGKPIEDVRLWQVRGTGSTVSRECESCDEAFAHAKQLVATGKAAGAYVIQTKRKVWQVGPSNIQPSTNGEVSSGTEREAENQTELPSEYYHRVFLGGDCLGATWEQLAFFQIMRKFEESVTTTEPTRPSELSQPGVAPGGGCCNRGDENG